MSDVIRNPSPPPLTSEEYETIHSDFIGDTVCSKKWVLNMLLKLYKHDTEFIYQTKNPNTMGANLDNGNHENAANDDVIDASDNGVENVPENMELNENFENSICELWDLSANNDVAIFLHENDCKDVFLTVMNETQSPRLMEICLGLFGNLVCIKEICREYSKDASFVEKILHYLLVTDTPSLVELTRLMKTCVTRDDCIASWLPYIRTHSSCEQLIYLMGNSLNVDLVSHTVEILDIVFDVDDGVIDCCLSSKFLDILIEAHNLFTNTTKEHSEAMTALLHIFQIMTTSNKGTELLNASYKEVIEFLLNCIIASIPTDECEIKDYTSTTNHCRLSYYASLCSTVSYLLQENSTEVLKLIDSRINALEFLIKYLHGNLVNCDRSEDTITKNFNIYFSVCFDSLYEIFVLAEKRYGEKITLHSIQHCMEKYKHSIESMIELITLLCDKFEALVKTAKSFKTLL